MEESKYENEPSNEGEEENEKVKSTRKHLSDESKQGIFSMLLLHSTQGKLNNRKVCYDIALKYGCSVDVVRRIWAEGKKIDASNPEDLKSFQERLKRKRGNNQKPVPFEENLFKSIPRHKRRSFRSIAYEFHEATNGKLKGHSKSSLQRKFKGGKFKRHSNAIKPSLTMYNTNVLVLIGKKEH